MQLKNTAGIGAFLRICGKSKDEFEVGFRNIACCFFGPFHQTQRVIPKILAEPCILKLFCLIESIKIKVIQVYARNYVNFNQCISRAFHRADVSERPQQGAHERGFSGAKVAIQPDNHTGSQ